MPGIGKVWKFVVLWAHVSVSVCALLRRLAALPRLIARRGHFARQPPTRSTTDLLSLPRGPRFRGANFRTDFQSLSPVGHQLRDNRQAPPQLQRPPGILYLLTAGVVTFDCVMTQAGEVQRSRVCFRCVKCQLGGCPLDERLGIDGRYRPAARRQICLGCRQFLLRSCRVGEIGVRRNRDQERSGSGTISWGRQFRVSANLSPPQNGARPPRATIRPLHPLPCILAIVAWRSGASTVYSLQALVSLKRDRVNAVGSKRVTFSRK